MRRLSVEDQERVSNLYAQIFNKVDLRDPYVVSKRVAIIEQLEKLIGCEFRDAQDFHDKVRQCLYGGPSEAERLRTARKAKGLTQRKLASILGVSQQLVCDMENGRKSLTRNALRFVDGVERG